MKIIIGKSANTIHIFVLICSVIVLVCRRYGGCSPHTHFLCRELNLQDPLSQENLSSATVILHSDSIAQRSFICPPPDHYRILFRLLRTDNLTLASAFAYSLMTHTGDYFPGFQSKEFISQMILQNQRFCWLLSADAAAQIRVGAERWERHRT